MSLLNKRNIRYVMSHFRDKFPIFFVGGFLFLAILAAIGIIQNITGKYSTYSSIPDTIFKVLQVLLFESGNITDDPAGWSFLGISRIVAPFLTLLFSVFGFYFIFTNAIRRFLVRRKKGHILLIGFGANSCEYIRNLGETADRCVLIAPELSQEQKSFLDEYRVLYYAGSIMPTINLDRNNDSVDDGSYFNMQLCERVAAHNAGHILILSDDDGFNIRAANVISYYLHNNKHNKPQFSEDIICGINDLLTYLQITESNLFESKRIKPLNLDIICAHDALRAVQPLKMFLIQKEQFQPVHLVVLGFGALGKALVKTFAEVACHSSSGDDCDKPIVTIIDMDADRKLDAFLGLFPFITNAIKIDKIASQIESISALQKLLDIDKQAKINNNRPVCVITINEPTLASSHILNLAGKLRDTNFEFFVRMPDPDPNAGWLIRAGKDFSKLTKEEIIRTVDKKDVTKWIEKMEQWEFLSKVTFFGCCTELYSDKKLFNTERLLFAKRFHEDYSAINNEKRVELNIKRSSDKQLEIYKTTEWEYLKPSLQYSNYCAVDHIYHKLSALDFPNVIDEVYQEDLAKLEHARWNAERYTAGWKYAEGDKNVIKKLNSCLTTWDKLPNDKDGVNYQEYDRVSARTMIKLVGEKGVGCF